MPAYNAKPPSRAIADHFKNCPIAISPRRLPGFRGGCYRGVKIIATKERPVYDLEQRIVALPPATPAEAAIAAAFAAVYEDAVDMWGARR